MENCKPGVKIIYSQPFYAGYNNSCFRGISSNGYLLPLEIEEELKPDNDDTKHQQSKFIKEHQQLRAMDLYLQKKLNEHIDRKKRESRF